MVDWHKICIYLSIFFKYFCFCFCLFSCSCSCFVSSPSSGCLLFLFCCCRWWWSSSVIVSVVPIVHFHGKYLSEQGGQCVPCIPCSNAACCGAFSCPRPQPALCTCWRKGVSVFLAVTLLVVVLSAVHVHSQPCVLVGERGTAVCGGIFRK